MRYDYSPDEGPQSYIECGRRILCKGGETTTIQKNDPPAYLQPYLTSAASRASQLSTKPFPLYQGDRIAPLNSQQEQGLNLTEQRALTGSPVMNAANTNLEATLRGDYLNPDSNPYLQNTVNQALGDVKSQINSQFSGNNFGSTAHQEWLGRSLANTALPIYAQNYADERNRQMQANLFAPQAAQSDYNDLQALLGVGDVRQQNTQQGLDFNFDQWQQAQQDPYNKLSWLAGILSGSPGSQSMSTGPNPYASNTAATALGGLASGAGTGALIGSAVPGLGTAWGAGIGAGVGLLGGLLR